MANASAMFSIEFLTEKDWLRLKSLRLHALKESPGAFLASHKQEAAYSDERWRAEFARGEWMVAVNGGTTVGILGATRDAPTPGYERYLEYIWVLPGSRRSGVASLLIGAVLEYLTNAGVRTVCLWVLNDNHLARYVYEKFGFRSTGKRQPLKNDPARSEELMTRTLP